MMRFYKHANGRFEDKETARDIEFAKQIASAQSILLAPNLIYAR